ncbi:glycosyl hydrolase family 28-related protein [Paenibacillus sp. SI8]|uniref:glycosyl hydrolase family 28-related protein n=1 Tax=unclassified Paenibacillus TaxID=185978 RepID=UPI00346670E4
MEKGNDKSVSRRKLAGNKVLQPAAAQSSSQTTINVKDHGAIGDGVHDDTTNIQNAFNTIISGGTIFAPAGTYLINGTIRVNGKNIIFSCDGKVEFIGTGSFNFDSQLSSSVNANNLDDGSNIVTSTISVVEGDYVQIAGDISHSDYSPSRYTYLKFVAKVEEVASGVIKLDRQIKYNLTAVTISKINLPYHLSIQDNIFFNGVGLTVAHAVGGKYRINVTGSIAGTSASGVYFNQCCDFVVNFKSIKFAAVFGMVMNDCNNFEAAIIATRTGLSDGTGSKAFRANGIQHARIKAIYTDSPDRDSTIFAARNLTYDVKSIAGGRYYRENNISTGNRLESVQFSESDDIHVIAEMLNCDDQAVEFLNVTNSTITAKRLHTLSGASEAPIVLKETCSHITIPNPVIRSNSPYGIKLECPSGLNTIKIINADIENSLARGSGIYIRDSLIEYDLNTKIIGGHIKAENPIVISAMHNGVLIKDTIVETTFGHAIQGLADYMTVDGVVALGCDGTTVRAVVSSGEHDQVTNVVSDGVIYIREQAKYKFSLYRYTNNRVPQIFIENEYIFYIKNGLYYVSGEPTLYTFENDTILYPANMQTGGIFCYICTTGGSKYANWVTNTSYLLGQRVNNAGNVYECITAGTSGESAPTGDGSSYIDGIDGVTWKFVSSYIQYTFSTRN